MAIEFKINHALLLTILLRIGCLSLLSYQIHQLIVNRCAKQGMEDDIETIIKRGKIDFIFPFQMMSHHVPTLF